MGADKKLNASSCILGKMVYLNCKWAYHLLICNEPSILNAFLITIGHEATHKEKELLNFLWYSKNNRNFISWVNEVHADFGGAQKAVQSSRKKLLASMNYKYKLYPTSKNTKSHPSWRKRIYYAERYNFNRKLIEKIAYDTKCKKQGLIDRACNFYDDIELK